jgi:hypothetical protein
MHQHDLYQREQGISVDYFVDDWKAKLEAGEHFCQQMIAYHDEAQCELSKASVKFKKFKDEDEAKAFVCPEGKKWSEVIHNDKGYFRAYNRAGELATVAVEEAGKYYKLKVPLTAGYNIGRNWAETH